MMRSSKGFPPVCDEDLIETIRQSKEVVPPALDGIWEDHVVVAVEGSTQQSHRQAYSLRTTMGGDVRFRIFLAFACFCSAFIFYQSMCAGMIHRLAPRCWLNMYSNPIRPSSAST